MRRAAVILAQGFEEIEAITSIDILKRAGVEVHIIGVKSKNICGSHNINILSDYTDGDLNTGFDCIVIPGGMPGSINISECENINKLILSQYKNKGLIGAICAAPGVVLGPLGILKDKCFTCYPGFEDKVPDGIFSKEPVVVSGNIVTSRGAGTAIDFSLKLVELLVSKEISEKIAKAIIHV